MTLLSNRVLGHGEATHPPMAISKRNSEGALPGSVFLTTAVSGNNIEVTMQLQLGTLLTHSYHFLTRYLGNGYSDHVGTASEAYTAQTTRLGSCRCVLHISLSKVPRIPLIRIQTWEVKGFGIGVVKVGTGWCRE